MKRLIICADGTWNIRDQLDEASGKRRPTNVTKVARAILPRSNGVDQVVFYLEGVGTNGGLDRLSGGAFGRGIEDNVRQLYRCIAYNYEAGDELYLFGFSRGAFTVRTLAGFLGFAGLLQKDDDYYLPDIYACYENSKGRGSPEWEHANRKIKGTRPAPPIRLVAVWDTVGALGAPGALGRLLGAGKYRYHQVGLAAHIHNAVQALALDEHRKPFLPDLWRRPTDWAGTLVQAWFPGVHSNVGGSYTPDGLANEALHWIVGEAEKLGLGFDSEYLAHFTPRFDAKLHDSMTLMYRALGQVQREVGQHLAAGECVHQAVLDRLSHAPSHYSHPQLRGLIERNAIPVVTTTRIARGGA